jgi:hypothetical protein
MQHCLFDVAYARPPSSTAAGCQDSVLWLEKFYVYDNNMELYRDLFASWAADNTGRLSADGRAVAGPAGAFTPGGRWEQGAPPGPTPARACTPSAAPALQVHRRVLNPLERLRAPPPHHHHHHHHYRSPTPGVTSDSGESAARLPKGSDYTGPLPACSRSGSRTRAPATLTARFVRSP